ncbi:MAG: cupin-like domain-containing protein, partial [Myxococcota bacterium]
EELASDPETPEWCLRESDAAFRADPDLQYDLDFAGVFPRLRGPFEHFLWAGPKGYVTGLHTDEVAVNLLCHLLGEKDVFVFAPGQEDRLYPTGGAVDGGRYSEVDPLDPDLEKHPKFRGLQGVQARLRPGDLLYIPQGHWHWARAESPCLSVSGIVPAS